MDFDCAADYFLRDAVRLDEEWMHRSGLFCFLRENNNATTPELGLRTMSDSVPPVKKDWVRLLPRSHVRPLHFAVAPFFSVSVGRDSARDFAGRVFRHGEFGPRVVSFFEIEGF